MAEDVATQAREAADLSSQLDGVSAGIGKEVVFQYIRTGRNLITVWAMSDGEPIPVPEYMLASVFAKRLADGTRMFTDNPDEAPKYVRGTTKCFLHAESIERDSGVLAEIGLAGKTCIAGSLASTFSERIHGKKRHSRERETYEAYLDEQKEAAKLKREEEQLEATLSIAMDAKAN